MIVETATDNNTEQLQILEAISINGGSLGTSGSVAFMFDHTCNFRINGDELDPEEIELEFIDHGAEEVFSDDDGILIYAPFDCFGSIQSELESRNIEILSSGFERIPHTTKELNEEQIAEVEKLLERLKKMMMSKTYITP